MLFLPALDDILFITTLSLSSVAMIGFVQRFHFFFQLQHLFWQYTFVQNIYVNLADKTFAGPAQTPKYIFMSLYFLQLFLQLYHHIEDDFFVTRSLIFIDK